MYQGTTVLGASSTIGGIALLPNTGGRPLLAYGAIAAITIGVSVLVMQIALALYRRSSRTK